MKEIMLICCAAGVFAFLFLVMERLDCWLEAQEGRKTNAEGSLILAEKPKDTVEKGNCRRKRQMDKFGCGKCENIKLQTKNT